MNSQQVRCVNSLCGSPIPHPKQGLTSCSKCSTNFILLCHQFPLTYHKNLKCTKCPNKFYYYNCEKCDNIVVSPNHRVGTVTSCKVCNDEGVFLTCGVCYKPWRTDRQKNMEGAVVQCRKCQGKYCYLTCEKCLQPIYSQKVFEVGEKVQCKNMKCRSEQVAKVCKRCKGVYSSCLESNAPHFCEENIPVSQYQSAVEVKTRIPQVMVEESIKVKPMTQTRKQTRAKENEKQERSEMEDNCCIVCLYKPKACVNTSCFHLNVCTECIPADGKCPLCRAVGEYKKVFI